MSFTTPRNNDSTPPDEEIEAKKLANAEELRFVEFRIEEAKEELKRCEEKKKEASLLDDRICAGRERMEKLNQDIEDTGKVNDKLQAEKENLFAEVRKAKTELDAVSREILSVKADEKAALLVIEQANHDIANAKATLEKETASLMDDISSKKRIIVELETTSSNLNEEIKQKRIELSKLPDELSVVQAELDGAVVKKNAVSAESAALSALIDERRLLLSTVKEQVVEVERLIQQKNAELADKNDKKAAELAILEESVMKRARWNEETKQKLITYKNDLEDYFKREFKHLII